MQSCHAAGMRLNCSLTSAAALALAGCGAEAARSDSVECGVALLIESYNAKDSGNPELTGRLGPVIQWHRARLGELSEDLRTPARAEALMRQYQADAKLRKAVAKGCVTHAYQNPEFTKAR